MAAELVVWLVRALGFALVFGAGYGVGRLHQLHLSLIEGGE